MTPDADNAASGRPAGEAFTTLLERAAAADTSAEREVFRLVYDELRGLAAELLADERRNHTLQPTELVHEAYARLVGAGDTGWKNRAHFFASAARAMRRLLIDHARARGAAKRGGGWDRVTLDAASETPGGSANPLHADVLAVSEAMQQLEAVDARAVRVVELRFFGGLSIARTAEVLGMAASTVQEDWTFARAWLGRKLES